MPEAAADRMVILGRLGGPWGVKGWIKVESFTDPPEALLSYPVWHVARPGGGWTEVKVTAGRAHGSGRSVVVALEGIGSPEEARRWGLRDVAMPRSALPVPKPGEYYWEDLVGCRVGTTTGRSLGVVSHFLDFPGNPVMVAVEGSTEHWVPLVPRHLKTVDLAGRQLTVDWDPEWLQR